MEMNINTISMGGNCNPEIAKELVADEKKKLNFIEFLLIKKQKSLLLSTNY